MAINLHPGDKKGRYEIVRELSVGEYARAYEARLEDNKSVFLKVYKSPSPYVPWFNKFVEHQSEIKRRIESDPVAKERCYQFIEFFTDRGGALIQVFEFIDNGMSLAECLEMHEEVTWHQLVTFAKVMMFGIKGLEQVKIVHTDLKPDNIYLIPDASIGMGYKLRIIDLDWAIFSDKQAPWHGIQGYVSTPGYKSPEHLRGEIPTPASDIFTCGIMLGEILGSGHPFSGAGDDYDSAAIAGDFKPIRLRDKVERVSDSSFLEVILNACLSPDPDDRPTAGQVANALIGKIFEWDGSTFSSPVTRPSLRSGSPVSHTPSDGVVAKGVEIYFEGQKITTVGIDSVLGKAHFKSIDSDARFLSDRQFRIFKQDGQWMIEHNPTATNETIVDSKKVTNALPIRDGMRVTVGNTEKEIEKFPLDFKLYN